MKLKPSLLKLIVTFMTVSLLASCAAETSQDCNRAQAAQGQPNQQVNNCPPNSSSGSRSYYGGSSGSRFGSGASDGSSGSRVGSGASNGGSHSTVGRSGFGSFGRGGHGGG